MFIENKVIRILLVDDEEEEFFLTRKWLSRIESMRIQLDWVPTWEEGTERIRNNEHDVYLIDYRLDDGNGLELFEQVKESVQDKPFLFLTSLKDSQTDLAVIQAGASDYLVKSEVTPTLLERSIRYAILRKEMDKTFQHYLKKLEESNNDLDQFATIASHDLQEPLRKVKTFTELLYGKFRKDSDPETLDYFDRIQNTVGRMQGLLSDLLAYSRIASQTPLFESTDLYQVVRGVLSDLEVQLQEADAQVHIHEIPVLEADPYQMSQLFQNIIHNALKFRKQKDFPVITIGSRYSKNSNNQPQVHISVEDNGIGFEEANAERIFHVFQRLHGRNDYPGTGVGLAICKRIVQRHGGSLIAKGCPGKGATFEITLPLTQRDFADGWQGINTLQSQQSSV